MDIKPFNTSDAEGFCSFVQAMLDIGAQIGGKVKVEDILPDRRTIANDAQKEISEKKKQLGKILQTHVADGNMTTDL